MRRRLFNGYCECDNFYNNTIVLTTEYVLNAHYFNGGYDKEQIDTLYVEFEPLHYDNGTIRTKGYILRMKEGFTTLREIFRDITTTLTVDLTNLDTSNLTDMAYMFYGMTKLTTVDFGGLDMTSITNMEYMFSGCTSLTSLDIKSLNLSNVTNMEYMFSSCSSLNEIDMNGLISENCIKSPSFNGCTNLKHIDLSNCFLNSPVYMTNCTSLENVCINNSIITAIYFDDCTSSYTLDLSGSILMNYFINSAIKNGAKIILLRNCDMSNIKYFSSNSTINTNNLEEIDFSNAIIDEVNTFSMFNKCSKLKKVIGLEDLSPKNLNSTNGMFNGCSSIETIDLSNWDFSKASDMSYMFYYCTSLKELKMLGPINSSANTSQMFSGINTNGTFYYNSEYDYSNIISVLPSKWTAVAV